jgi:hypothetical protein
LKRAYQASAGSLVFDDFEDIHPIAAMFHISKPSGIDDFNYQKNINP